MLSTAAVSMPANANSVFSKLHPDDQQAFWDSIRKSDNSLQTWSTDFRLIKDDNQVSWLHVDARPEQQNDGTILWHGYITDITDRKKLENIKSEFISVVNHELRTPLTSIRGSLGLLIGMFASSMPEKARELLLMANSNSDRLTIMINDLLDLEKMDSGKFSLDIKTVNIRALTEQAIKSAEGYASQFKVNMRLVEAPENIELQLDENRMLQVYANLLSNAIKFSPEGGTVEISVRKFSNHIRVGIFDQGSGIPEEFHSKIFQRFSQADSSDTRKVGGSGLGLSITKAIIEQHGGTIGFNTEIGKGTEFFFVLPMSQA